MEGIGGTAGAKEPVISVSKNTVLMKSNKLRPCTYPKGNRIDACRILTVPHLKKINLRVHDNAVSAAFAVFVLDTIGFFRTEEASSGDCSGDVGRELCIVRT